MNDVTASSPPLVTVLLPCYNAERFLPFTLESLLAQSYRHLEVLAIDDGSVDSTPGILRRFAERDARVRVETNPGNLGLIRTLNRGVSLARGALIARMDADDIAMPERIAEQVSFFERHPSTELLATDVTYIRESGEVLFEPAPYRFSSKVLRFMTFFVNPICHPTVMGRRTTFERFPYEPQAVHIEDFELWTRMLEHGVVIRQLPRRLLRFRPNLGSVSSRHQRQQTELFLRTSAAAIERYFGLRLEPAVQRILTNRMEPASVRATDLRNALETLQDMRSEFVAREQLSRADRLLLERFLGRHLASVLHHAYARTAPGDPGRRLAGRALMALALHHPRAVSRHVIERLQSRRRSREPAPS